MLVKPPPISMETMAARVAASTGHSKISSEALKAATDLKVDPKKMAAAAGGFSLRFDAPKFGKK
jgi:hypothetical protein